MGGGASNLRSDMEELISCTYLLGRTLASMSFPDMYRLQDFHSPSAPALKSELAREALSADLDRSMRETRAALAAARAAEAVQYEKIIKLQDELEEKGGPSSTTIGILKALYREFNAIDDIDSAQEVYDQLVLLTKELLAPLAERNLLPTSMMHK